MLISHQHKFITIDIPKTGSRSLRESLLPLNIIDVCGTTNLNAEFYQHGDAASAEKQFYKNNWNWNGYFKFTIARNPWCRYFSFFKYFKSYGEKYLRRDKSINWKEPELNQGKHCAKLFQGKDERAVLKNIILNNSSQDSYYCNESRKIIVDYIATFEDFQNEFVFLCDKVGIQAPNLNHGNKSEHSIHIHDLYNQELIDLVAQKEKNIIELKGYNYE